MDTRRTMGDASVFIVLFAPTSGSVRRRRWMSGRLYVGFNRATLVEDTTRKSVCVASGTGLRPNAVFAMMQAAENGAAWQTGTELKLERYVVQIEDVVHLHLLPYATCCSDTEEGANAIDEGETSAAAVGNNVNSVNNGGVSDFERPGPHNLTMGFAEMGRDKLTGEPPRRRSRSQLIQELQAAYPHFFS
ncbi:uncharacterized protein TM35_000202330 [Trypanosoma theileri]|uniref:Uncharacterized protein n=1 Tax=Trypanosoma theileri TaxID=67003 RepID=A0A1X0NSZ3_9TRYP|nr:uncharacterized protein TM35_000202330 [Trypanosoma theileri]ORC87824.1 hypothetical protein TM35_000202330 [Trypanosoma theileri]